MTVHLFYMKNMKDDQFTDQRLSQLAWLDSPRLERIETLQDSTKQNPLKTY